MKREYSWGIAGVLAIAATAGLSLQQGGSRSKEGASSQAERRGSAGAEHPLAKEESSEQLACDDIAKALRLFLNVDQSNLALPESCSGPQDKPRKVDSVTPAKDLHLKFVIATLPDPIHTHLPLLFDRMTEAIQEAAQDDHYSYESSWMPWEDKESRHTRLVDDDVSTDRREKQEGQPGILLFRKNESSKGGTTGQEWGDSGSLKPYQDGLVVLIVGEDPTRGIHLEQFRNAVLWIEQLKMFDSDALVRTGILGPSFSGSFHSLEKLLTAPFPPDGSHKARTPSEIESLNPGLLPIYSGTANGRDSTKEFAEFVASAKPPMEFHHFMETDEVGLERYCRFVNEWRVVKTSDQADGGASHSKNLSIAIISEDETAFGSDTNSQRGTKPEFPCISTALWLYYPRDISSLRAAYQANSIFDSSAPQQLSDVGRGSLPTDLADPEGNEHDTIRSYAGNQTPLSQEAYLLGLVNAMREAHSEYIILRSTNSLDQIFLARYLHRAYPDARIVIDGADNLFERERGATGMAGTLSLSTYPLLERQRAWLAYQQPETSSDHRSFNSDFSEATYIAFRMLLHSTTLNQIASGTEISSDTHVEVYSLSTDTRSANPPMLGITGSLPMVTSGRNPSIPLADYGLPLWQEKTPWSIVRDTHESQVSLTPPTWISVIGRDGFWAIASLNEDTLVNLSTYTAERMELEIPASLKVTLVVLAIFAGFHLWCCSKASFTAKPAFRTHFINPGDNRHIFLVFLGSVFVTLLPLLAAWGCGWFDPQIVSNDIFTNIAVLVVLALSLRATFANIKRINFVRKKNTGSRSKQEPSSADRILHTLKLFVSQALLATRPPRLKPRPRSWISRRLLRLCAKYHLSTNRWIILVGLLICLTGFVVVFVRPIDHSLTPANRFFAYYRSVHLLSGVSPTVPFLAITVGMYLWFWYSLHGLALFGRMDSCKLPKEADLKYRSTPVLRMFSQQTAAHTVEAGKPLACHTVERALAIWFTLIFFTWAITQREWAVTHSVPIRTLGPEYSADLILVCLLGCFSLMLAEAWQLLIVWSKLRTLLVFLDRTALRRTLAALRGFSWGSVWKMSGNVLDVRYKLMSRQFESLQHTRAALEEWVTQKKVQGAHCCTAAGLAACNDEFNIYAEMECIRRLDATYAKGGAFALKYAEFFDKPDAGDFQTLKDFQVSVARTSGYLLINLLIPEWQRQKCSLILEEDQKPNESSTAPEPSLPLSDKEHIRNAEEFVCLPYLGFVQNILGRIRTLTMGILCLFIATAVAVSSYPFDPRQGLGLVMLILFSILVGVIIYVYAQIHRDTTLSHITNTTPGELGGDFWLKLVGFGLAPLLGLLTAVFPSISDFIFSWLQPGLQSIK
jgi:hypothetical protein